MVGRFRVVAALLVLTPMVLSAASAQQPNPIVQHFQAYRQALDAQDFATAETEAVAALAASEQRDGDGGRTAVLSFNLASLRVQRERYGDAVAPAQRALTLAQTRGASSGVDQVAARIVLARAQLGRDGVVSTSILRAALQEAERRDDLAGDRYDALAQLGLMGLAQENYPLARRAWADAATVAALSGEEGRAARGRAKGYEGIALAIPFIADDDAAAADGTSALSAFTEARPLLQPAATIDSADGALTADQALYARVLAWDGAVRTRLRERDITVSPALAAGASGAALTPALSPPACALILHRSAPAWPRSAENSGEVGTVVARLRFAENGALRAADVAASVGGQAFRDAAALSIRSWTGYYNTGSPANCQVPPVYFARIGFAYD